MNSENNISRFTREEALELLSEIIVWRGGEGGAKQAEQIPRIIMPEAKIIDPESKGYLRLENIVCTSSDGKIFEDYPVLYIARDVVRGRAGSPEILFTPYKGIAYFEEQDTQQFVPSLALTCNILVALYDLMEQGNLNAKQILKQYNEYGIYGWYAQNTIVKWSGNSSEIIHYPHNTDFSSNSGSKHINCARPHTRFRFDPRGSRGFGNMPLTAVPVNSSFESYLKNLTGLTEPRILSIIGDYFNKPTDIWTPQIAANSTYSSATWIGCSSNTFCIVACSDLSNNYAIRGVLIQKMFQFKNCE